MSTDLVAQWAVVLGIVNPVVVAAITRQTWGSRKKSFTMVSVVLATTAIGMIIDGSIYPTSGTGWRDWMATLLVVFVTTHTTYRALWKPTGAAEKVESTINAGEPPVVPERAMEETTDETPEIPV